MKQTYSIKVFSQLNLQFDVSHVRNSSNFYSVDHSIESELNIAICDLLELNSLICCDHLSL